MSKGKAAFRAESKRFPQPMDVSQLLLDSKNYRLPEGHGSGQPELLRILDRDFSLLDIGRSIVDNGYFPEEPMSVVKESSGKFTVIEGNRRLAALRLLLEPSARRNSSNPHAWDELASRMRHDVSKVPVIVYENRDQLTTFLGYRHIAGIVRWDPLSKATFINAIVEGAGRKADFGLIARTIGSYMPTVRNNYIAYRIMVQARDDFEIDTKNLEKNFSVFYRALSSDPITRFIGLKKRGTPYQLRNPIPKNKRDALDQLIGYVHGTADNQAVLTDSRQLTALGEILDNFKARSILEETRDLESAQKYAINEGTQLADVLSRASYYLDEALKFAHRHSEDSGVAEQVHKCGLTMMMILQSFPGIRAEVLKQ
jgi:hypothetical protein